MYLLDTNVVSELRKPRPHQGVVAWINAVPAQALFLSAVTIGEIQAGINLTREQDAAKAEQISAWLDLLEESYGILPADAVVFRRWAHLTYRRSDQHLEDALIAATALVRGLTVATRNVDGFKGFGVQIINPFDQR